MKIIVLGLGSVGSRHLANLMALRPSAHIVIAEPQSIEIGATYVDGAGNVLNMSHDWRQVLADNADADGAIIASPTGAHLEQMTALARAGISFYVEKPLWSDVERSDIIGEWGVMGGEWYQMAHIVGRIEEHGLRCATGFQYRYHAAVQASREMWRRNGFMSVCAYDDLLARYGRTVGGTMASHPIALALWTLGGWHAVDLFSDGVMLRGAIAHEGTGFSHFDICMDAGARTSRIATHGQAGTSTAELKPDNDMYLRSLGAWLDYVETGKHDGMLATLADGMAVMRVLDEVKEWPKTG